MKGWRMGTVGRVPPENFDRAVEAAPDHDTFAVGADLCFMLARPDLMNEDVNMFTHSVSMSWPAAVPLRMHCSAALSRSRILGGWVTCTQNVQQLAAKEKLHRVENGRVYVFVTGIVSLSF